MSGTVTFDGAPPAGFINLGIGQPSADLLPINLIRQASEAFFNEAHPLELNYGVLAGDERFLESLAGYLEDSYHDSISPESLFVTAGNSQALDFVSTVFSKAGDTVFVEEPSYYLAFQIFRDHGLNVVGVPVDEDGINIDALEELSVGLNYWELDSLPIGMRLSFAHYGEDDIREGIARLRPLFD